MPTEQTEAVRLVALPGHDYRVNRPKAQFNAQAESLEFNGDSLVVTTDQGAIVTAFAQFRLFPNGTIQAFGDHDDDRPVVELTTGQITASFAAELAATNATLGRPDPYDRSDHLES